MINSRNELANYAMEICLPLIERTAERRLAFTKTEVNDGAGYLLTFVEAFCRPLWGIAPIIKESNEDFYINIRGQKVEVCSWIREVLLDAVDSESPYTWNMTEGMDSTSYPNQMKTELAGLMIGMFLAREKLWDQYTTEEKKKIADWIYKINEAAYQVVWDCNHIWFVVLNLTILKKLGFTYEKTDQIIREALSRLDGMYIGNGFYQDGQFGRFDYYVPWAMHTYPMLWLIIEDESFDGYNKRKQRYLQRTNEFLDYYSHVFDSTGCHIPFGRSLAYRFAASSIFPLAIYHGCEFDPGLARTITLKNISYFQDNATLEQGVLPPGFLYQAPQTVENYTSDGGAYWCTKAFLALLMPEEHPFWSAEAKALPIEQGNFIVGTGSSHINMPLVGNKDNGVTLYNNTANYLQNNKKTHWFLDMEGFYSKFAYNSRAGFGVSIRDGVSYDNMISLITPNGTMESHRMGFEDLGNECGMLKSRHIPFANDNTTVIDSWIIPLSDGFDVRVHRVKLSQEYSVREGGFTVPMPTDYKEVIQDDKSVVVKSKTLRSGLTVYSNVKCNVGVKGVHPGMHLLEPMACYPCYETEVLKAGEYIFASVMHLSSNVNYNPINTPEINIEKNSITISYQKQFFKL